jgi:hypothetical protein
MCLSKKKKKKLIKAPNLKDGDVFKHGIKMRTKKNCKKVNKK